MLRIKDMNKMVEQNILGTIEDELKYAILIMIFI